MTSNAVCSHPKGPQMDDLDGVLSDPSTFSATELALAARNHGMPLEAMHYDITPAGLHYLLLHYDIPVVAPDAFRLRIGGRVRAAVELTLDDLRARPATTIPVTMECAGNGRAHMAPRPLSQPWLDEAVGTGLWTGCSLAALLDEVGLLDDAVDVVFSGADRGIEGGTEQRYERGLPVAEARRPEVLLAYEMSGMPLLPQHGAPLRLVVPGWYGMTNVKWLTDIRIDDVPFDGYQHRSAYRMRHDRDDAGVPLTRMRARALMVPPGIPDFPTRARRVPTGSQTLHGRAWSGAGAVAGVDVSTDGGRTWAAAALDEPVGPFAWRGWSFTWAPTAAGEHELRCRARDADGVQPDGAEWNVGGYANNAVQRVVVTVTGPT